MQGFWSTAVTAYQKAAERVQEALNEIDAEMNENVHAADRNDNRELEVYKNLLEDAQMQHVQMTKHFNELMLEKESELRHWKSQAAEALGTNAEELKFSTQDGDEDVDRLKSEREMLKETLEQTETRMREILRNQNNREVVIKKYEDKIQELSELKTELDRKLRSHEDLMRQLTEQREKEKNSTDTIENLAEEYSKLAADAEIRQQNDRVHLQELERQNEQLRTKMAALEATLTQLADNAATSTGDQSPSSDGLQVKQLREKLINLEYDLGEKVRETEELKKALQNQASNTAAADQSNEELVQLRRQLRDKEASFDKIAAELQALQNEVTVLRSAGTTNEAEHVQLIQQLNQQKQDAVNEVTARMESSLQALRNEYEQQLKASSDQLAAVTTGASNSDEAHAQALQAVRQDLEGQQARALAAAEQERQVAVQQALAEANASHAAALRDAQASAQQAQTAAVEAALSDAVEERTRAIQDADNKHQQALAQLAQEAEARLAAAVSEAESRWATAQQTALAVAAKQHADDKQQALNAAAQAANERQQQALMEAEAKTDERLSKQRAMFETKLSQAAEEKAALTEELQNVAAKHQRQISKAVEEAEQRKDQEKQAALVEQRRAMEKRIADAEASVEEYKALYTKENRMRKLVHNKLLELQGNIRVFCRARPILEVERRSGQDVDVTEFPSTEDIVIHRDEQSKSRYEFDRSFTPASTQEEVFEQVQPLVVSCLDGFNVCIFAYGQTGSGKTFTMEGPPDNRGVSHRAISELFNLQEQRSEDWTYQFTYSMLEIYNESLRDLLGDQSAKLDIRQTPQGNSVPGLTEIDVTSVEQVLQLMESGQGNRAVGAHDMNEHSSRSHSILTIQARGVNKHDGSQSFGKLHLIDLAGSERVSKTDATGDRLKEAQNINRSLSALGDVINALCSRKTGAHIPYRNSKLTFLLQDSLGGNSKVMMFVNISPAVYNVSETLCSLNFAARCRNVELGAAKRQTEAVAKLTKTGSRLSMGNLSSVSEDRNDPPSPTGSIVSTSSAVSTASKATARRAAMDRTRSLRLK